jgi:purine-binding chemotaxis protein CheW
MMRALLVPVGIETYAIELGDVLEVVETPAVIGVPTAPDAVLGLFNLRGDVVVLLDTGMLLGSEAAEEMVAVVIVDSPLGSAGLSATGDTRTVELGEAIGESRMPNGRGRYRFEDLIVTLLDLPAVIEAVHGPAL